MAVHVLFVFKSVGVLNCYFLLFFLILTYRIQYQSEFRKGTSVLALLCKMFDCNLVNLLVINFSLCRGHGYSIVISRSSPRYTSPLDGKLGQE